MFDTQVASRPQHFETPSNEYKAALLDSDNKSSTPKCKLGLQPRSLIITCIYEFSCREFFMRLRHIEIFHAVYTNGSISNAARFLNISQPSVSKTLKHAEDQLGYKLFERVKGKLIPTKEAHRLFEEVSTVYAQLDGLNRLSENLGAKKEGVVRIATTPALGLEVIPLAAASFMQKSPDSKFVLETLHLGEILSCLREGKVDIGMAFSPANHQNIREFDLGKAELVCLAPPDFPMPDSRRIELKDIEGSDFIKLHGKGPLGRFLNQHIASSGIELNTVASVETYHMAQELVALGAGISVVDEITARSSRQPHVQRRLINPATKFDIKALTVESEPISLGAQDFIAHTRETVSSFLDRPLNYSG